MTDGSKLSRTAKVLSLSLGGGVALLASIAFSMVASRNLSKHDYATLKQTFLAYELAAPLLLLGLPTALYYFLPRAHGDRRGVLIDNVVLLSLGGAIFSLFILLGGNIFLADRFDNPDLVTTLPWLSIYSLAVMPVAGLMATLVHSERVGLLTVFNTLSGLLIALSGIAAVLVTRTFEGPVLVRIMVVTFLLPVALVLMFRVVSGPWRYAKISSMVAMVRYAVPLGLATTLGTVTMQMHAFIVASLCPPEEFAVYINGAIELPVIGVVTGSITSVIFAEMSKQCADGKREDALTLFKMGSQKSAWILFPSLVFFLIVAEPFILTLYSDEYIESTIPFMIYLGVLPARIVVYGAAMMALGMNREILFRSIFDLLINAVLCWIFVSIFGATGAALGLVVTIYLWSIPFNLAKLAEGFSVGWKELLPWRELSIVLLSSVGAAIPLIFARAALSPLAPVIDLTSSAVIYGVAVIFAMHRTGNLKLTKKNFWQSKF